MEYHLFAGCAALGLVVFRVAWGFTGGRHARFPEFLKGWGEVKSYIRGLVSLRPPKYLGHNPAVGWAMLFMLATIALITLTGVITYGGEEGRGILAGVVSFKAGITAKAAHEVLAYSAIIMIAGHFIAALFHEFILKEKIILSMVTGKKECAGIHDGTDGQLCPEKRGASQLLVLVSAVVIAAAGLFYVFPEKGETAFDAGVIEKAAGFKVWRSECAESCHNAFHPSLLPAASWRAMVASDGHFGDNLSLDPKTRQEVTDFLAAYSAEQSASEVSKKIMLSSGQAPARITVVRYWKDKHSEISESVFSRKSIVSRSNCAACHPGAESGSFEDKDIKIPVN